MKKYFLIISAILLIGISCKKEEVKTQSQVTVPVAFWKYCFINNFSNEEIPTLDLDFIEYAKTSELDKSIKYPQILELPNGFCYVNKEKNFERFDIADSVEIIMQTFSRDTTGNYNFNQKITLNELMNAINNPPKPAFLSHPFIAEIVSDKIITIKEVYIP